MELKEYTKNPMAIAKDIRAMVASGEVNPIAVKQIYDIFSQAMKDDYIKDAIMAEADKYEGEFEVNGLRYKKQSSTTYTYKHDAVWQQIEAQKKSREELMKMALKHEVADPSTGEIVPAAEKTSSEFLKRV
jgi:hypothetical protein